MDRKDAPNILFTERLVEDRESCDQSRGSESEEDYIRESEKQWIVSHSFSMEYILTDESDFDHEGDANLLIGTTKLKMLIKFYDWKWKYD